MEGARRGPRLVAVAALFYGTAGLLALAWMAWRRGGDGLWAQLVGHAPARSALAGLGAGLAIVGASAVMSQAWPAARLAEDAFARILGPLTTAECVALALFSGLGEELVFRGALQPAVGLLAAALIFGLVHVPPDRDLALWPAVTALVGLLLGWLALRTGGLIAPVVAHATVNALNLRRMLPRPVAAAAGDVRAT